MDENYREEINIDLSTHEDKLYSSIILHKKLLSQNKAGSNSSRGSIQLKITVLEKCMLL